jgi:hypothetical protein
MRCECTRPHLHPFVASVSDKQSHPGHKGQGGDVVHCPQPSTTGPRGRHAWTPPRARQKLYSARVVAHQPPTRALHDAQWEPHLHRQVPLEAPVRSPEQAHAVVHAVAHRNVTAVNGKRDASRGVELPIPESDAFTRIHNATKGMNLRTGPEGGKRRGSGGDDSGVSRSMGSSSLSSTPDTQTPPFPLSTNTPHTTPLYPQASSPFPPSSPNSYIRYNVHLSKKVHPTHRVTAS